MVWNWYDDDDDYDEWETRQGFTIYVNFNQATS